MSNKNIEKLVMKPITGPQKDGLEALFDIAEFVPIYHSASKISGIGVFTPMDLEKDTFIGVGHVFHKGFWYMTTHGNYNHSENPNCSVEVSENVTVLKTIEPILHGEELTVDYRKQQFLEQPGDDWV